MDPHLVMAMASRAPAGGPHVTHHIPTFDRLAHLDLYSGIMAIAGAVSVTMSTTTTRP